MKEKLLNIMNKIKELALKLLPSIENLIKLAPFVTGVAVGYLFRTPISWALDIIKLLLKL